MCKSITFDANGKMEYAGTQAQNFLATNSYKINFIPELIINNPNGVSMNTDNVIVTTKLYLKNGKFFSDAQSNPNYLTCSELCQITYQPSCCINGPIKILSNSISTRIIPLGKGNVFRNFILTAGDNANSEWLLDYFYSPQAFGSALAPGLTSVSQFEYFRFDRVSGTAPGYAQIEWGHNSGVTNPANLTVARWSGSMWEDAGNIGIQGNSDSGNVASSTMTSFGYVALASTDNQQLPVELSSFNVGTNRNNVTLSWATTHELNNSGFEIERKSTLDSN